MMFNYPLFEQMCQENAEKYLRQSPYPYAIFDGLFSESLLNEVDQEVERAEYKKDVREISEIEVKTRSNFEDNEALPKNIKSVFEIINGGKFLTAVSRLTGIPGLISDPYYDGGGVNVIENGGTLAVHVDGTTQHRLSLCRRINAILFLNDDWDKDWNGYHEQWEYINRNLSPFDADQEWRCVRKILPKRNRLLVFTTNDHSWHGHAGLLDIPEGVKRKSLIAYYYTASRPDSDLVFENPHRAIFVKNSITLKDDAFLNVEVVK